MSDISKLAKLSAANSTKTAAFPLPLLGAGLGAGYGAGSAPKGEVVQNMVHHGARGGGAGIGATLGGILGAGAGSGLADVIAKLRGVDTKPRNVGIGALAGLLAGGVGGGVLGNKGVKALLGKSPGERDEEKKEEAAKLAYDQLMEKEAFKAFGLIDDALRLGAKGIGAAGRWGWGKGTQAVKGLGGPRGRVGEAIMGRKGWAPTAMPKGLLTAAPSKYVANTPGQLAGAGIERLGIGAANTARRAGHWLAQSGNPGQGLGRLLGKGALLGTGAMAAKDLATLPFGGWKSKDSKGMRQGGLDYQRQAINPANSGYLGAALAALGSPLKSVASLGLGDPNASPVRYKDTYMGQSPSGVRRWQRTPTAVGPLAARKQRELQEAQQEYDILRSGKESELEKAREEYAAGSYGDAPGGSGFFGLFDPYDGDENARRAAAKAMARSRLDRLKGELRSGEYADEGMLWDGPSAADLQKTISQRERYLRGQGLGAGAGLPATPWVSRADTADEARRLSLSDLGY